jgi:hypothetical protein
MGKLKNVALKAIRSKNKRFPWEIFAGDFHFG